MQAGKQSIYYHSQEKNVFLKKNKIKTQAMFLLKNPKSPDPSYYPIPQLSQGLIWKETQHSSVWP